MTIFRLNTKLKSFVVFAFFVLAILTQSVEVFAAFNCGSLESEKYFTDHKDAFATRGPVGTLTPIPRKSYGSQKGGWFRDQNNTEWYLKPDAKTPQLQTGAEVITAAIYRYLGFKVPRTVIYIKDGVRYAAVESIGNDLTEVNTPSSGGDKYFNQLRAFAAFTKDWDRLRVGGGGGYNNAEVDGKFVLFDFGGSLGARAGGDPKPGEEFSPAIGTFEANLTYEQILASYRVNWLPPSHPWRQPFTIRELQDVGRKFSYLTNEAIGKIVKLGQYENPQDAAYMEQALRSRRDEMIKGIQNEVDGASQASPKIPKSNASLAAPVKAVQQFNGKNFDWKDNQAYAQTGQLGNLSAPIHSRLAGDYVGGTLWQVLPSYLLGQKTYKKAQNAKEVPVTPENLRIATEAVKNLDQYMARLEALPMGLNLYRGKTTNRPLQPMENGEQNTELLYLPTSIDLDVAKYFIEVGLAKYEGMETVSILTKYRIMTPNVKGLFIPAWYQATNKKMNEFARNEHEILLDRGLTFRGLGWTTMVYKGKKVYVEEVGVYE